ncbi:MAG TPA: NfeD family protein [Candidatus Binatia bacterium]|jgi:membrane protein implicated in regulation of membrane protease activity
MFWVWLLLGVVLVFFELHHLAFYAMFVAAGAFGAAVVAAVDPSATTLQGIVFVSVAVAGVAAVRPYVSKAYERRHPGGEGVRGVHGGFVGQRAFTLDVVGDTRDVGHVQLAGERWLAICKGGDRIPPDTAVVVAAVEGTTFVVVPEQEYLAAGAQIR